MPFITYGKQKYYIRYIFLKNYFDFTIKVLTVFIYENYFSIVNVCS